MAYYDNEAGPLGEALELAIGLSMLRPPAHERIFAMSGLIEIDWDRARHCHHTNMPLVAAIGGMIDPVAAEGALGPKYRLVDACGQVSVIDEAQENILLAAAGKPKTSGRDAQRFTQAVLGLIEQERLEEYFEIDDKADYHGIQPLEMEYVKTAAKALEQDRRIPLVIVLSLYNEHTARNIFKGRGWAFHGVCLGRWLRSRFKTNRFTARHALTALGSYPGW